MTLWESVQQHLRCNPDPFVVCLTIRGRGPWWHCAHRVVDWDLRCGARSARRTAGLVPWGWLPTRPFLVSSIFSEMCCSDPMGVPNTVIPAGCHTSSPSSSMASGGIPAQFQALVFPWCNWMPATRDSNNSYNTFTLEGSHKRCT